MQRQQPNKQEAVLGLGHLYRCYRQFDSTEVETVKWIFDPPCGQLMGLSVVVWRSPLDLAYTGKNWSCYRSWSDPGYRFHTKDFYAVRDTECWRTQWVRHQWSTEWRTQLLLVVFTLLKED